MTVWLMDLTFMTMRHQYTKEEDQWLVEHIHKCNSYIHLTEMFNEHFGTSISSQAISDRCIKRLGIHRECNTGLIQYGNVLAKTRKIGTEMNYNGYIWIKYNDIKHDGVVNYNAFKENWMPKHRYIYMQLHGEIPDGYFVIFLNNDKSDFDPDNLYAVPRNIHQMMCKNRWYTDNSDNTLAAIKYCELFYALRKQ